MSSFIVDKKEFIKAAGLMCGYEQGKGRDSHKWFVENVREQFVNAYRLNVMSFNEQYGESIEEDDKDYDEEFESYRKMGALIRTEGYGSDNGVVFEKVADVMDKRTFARSMWKFFDSVLYQIENDDAHCTVSELFYICLHRLYERDLHGIDGWWGEVELKVA